MRNDDVLKSALLTLLRTKEPTLAHIRPSSPMRASAGGSSRFHDPLVWRLLRWFED